MIGTGGVSITVYYCHLSLNYPACYLRVFKIWWLLQFLTVDPWQGLHIFPLTEKFEKSIRTCRGYVSEKFRTNRCYPYNLVVTLMGARNSCGFEKHRTDTRPVFYSSKLAMPIQNLPINRYTVTYYATGNPESRLDTPLR